MPPFLPFGCVMLPRRIILVTALVPLADMLNHSSRSDPPNNCDWKVENGAFVIRVVGNLRPGDEACHSYGLYANSHYLSRYGFAVECNTRHDGASPDTALIMVNGVSFVISIGDVKAAKTLLAALRKVATKSDKCAIQTWDVPFLVRNG